MSSHRQEELVAKLYIHSMLSCLCQPSALCCCVAILICCLVLLHSGHTHAQSCDRRPCSAWAWPSHTSDAPSLELSCFGPCSAAISGGLHLSFWGCCLHTHPHSVILLAPFQPDCGYRSAVQAHLAANTLQASLRASGWVLWRTLFRSLSCIWRHAA